jgi:hypothetical protein
MQLGEKISDEGTQFFRSEIQFPQDALEFNNRLPHFEADLTTHGLQLFNNFKAICIMICIFVHSTSLQNPSLLYFGKKLNT